jgi:type IV secretory pathway VirB10-like protein
MIETKSPEDSRENVEELLAEPADSDSEHGESQRHRWREAFRRSFLGTPESRTPVTKRDLSQDRTRALMLLIGGVVGSVLLFLGIFSTPPTRSSQVERGRVQPNLGRPAQAETARLASVTPLLSAEVHADDPGQDGLSAADIQNTSGRDVAGYDLEQETAFKNPVENELTTISANDRRMAYRRNQLTGAMTYNSGVPAAPDLSRTPADSISSGTFSYDGSSPQPALPSVNGAPKSSIVFVRSTVATTAQPTASTVNSPGFDPPTLLAPGSRLIARLESAVTSALKAPVVAAIEYNYEREGVILIPAGTKAIGELQQTSINGYVGIAFHSLQMPDGRNETIEAIAMDLRNEPLKGKVTGTNKGRKFITRTLSGVGTIAAYVVGGGGSGLGQTITGETLLRDRFASNIASAGEQELTNAAYSQNIVVTVPAQTRLNIVFRNRVVGPAVSSSVPSIIRSPGAEVPTAQELRELMDLRREINRMYEASAAPPNSTKQ